MSERKSQSLSVSVEDLSVEFDKSSLETMKKKKLTIIIEKAMKRVYQEEFQWRIWLANV